MKKLIFLATLVCILSCEELQPASSPTPDKSKPEEQKPQPEEKVKELTLLFTNDVHSQIMPLDEDASYNANRGGLARIKVLADSVRAVDKAVLVCDAGDYVQGTYYFNCFNGEVEMMAQKEIGYDIKTIGNHEYDKKMTGLDYMMRLNEIPIVSSNYDFQSTTLADRVEKSHLFEIKGLRIGFIGLNHRLLNLVDPNYCEGVVFYDAIDDADRLAKELKDKGADMVIALSHLGYSKDSNAKYYDKGIALNTKYIDAIIGGHTHTFLNQADYVKNLLGRDIPIVQTGSKGICLGYMKVKFTDSGSLIYDYRLIPVDKRLDDRLDASFTAKIDYYTDLMADSMNEVLAYCPQTMRKGIPESTLSNFTTDAIADICEDEFGVRPDFAMYNSGGMRTEIKSGDVTRSDVYKTYPFDNTLCLIELKGEDVLNVFGLIAKYGGEPVSKEINLEISNGKIHHLTIGGEPVDPNKLYKVASINYMIDATSYNKFLSKYTSRRESTSFIYELMSDYVKKLGDSGKTVSAELDGRIVIL